MTGGVALRGALISAAAALAGLVAGEIVQPSGAALAVLLVAVVALGGAFAGWLALVRPALAVRNVARAAGKIAEGELDQRVEDGGGPVSEELYVELAARLKQAHRRVATLDVDDDEKARVAKRLIALTDASKRDVERASLRLDLLLARRATAG